MSLTDFINWLFSNILRVTRWFGDRFNIYLDILENIGSRIQSFIEPVKNYILDRLIALKNDLWKEIVDHYNRLINNLNTLSSWVSQEIGRRIQEVTNLIGGSIDQVVSFVNSLRSEFTTLINNGRAELEGFINDRLNYIQDVILSPYRPLLQIVNNVDRIIDLISIDTYKKIRFYLDKALPIIISFIDHPVAFIFDLLSPLLVSVLCWAVAQGLGSEKESIDLTPPWKK